MRLLQIMKKKSVTADWKNSIYKINLCAEINVNLDNVSVSEIVLDAVSSYMTINKK